MNGEYYGIERERQKAMIHRQREIKVYDQCDIRKKQRAIFKIEKALRDNERDHREMRK